MARPSDAAVVQIDEQRRVAVPLADRFVVDPETRGERLLAPEQPARHSPSHHSINHVIGEYCESCSCADRPTLPEKVDDVLLKRARQTPARLGPRNGNTHGLAVLEQKPRNPCGDDRLKMTGVEMTLRPLPPALDLSPLARLRVGPHDTGSALHGDPDEAVIAVKSHLRDLPRSGNAEGLGVERLQVETFHAFQIDGISPDFHPTLNPAAPCFADWPDIG